MLDSEFRFMGTDESNQGNKPGEIIEALESWYLLDDAPE
jgi:hypothetical protein